VLILTDELIAGTIDSIGGFIVTAASEQLDKSLEATMDAWLASRTYALLSDRETGYYWDSVPELLDMFIAELS
jgi:hypothetical protein